MLGQKVWDGDCYGVSFAKNDREEVVRIISKPGAIPIPDRYSRSL